MNRLFDLYRTSSSGVAIATLIVVNLVPLVGVLFLGWDLGTILILYWVENGIVGLFNVPKMLLARGSGPAGTSDSTPVVGGLGGRLVNIALVPFFLIHYGAFWLGHGFFIFVFVLVMGGLFEAFGGGGGFEAGPSWDLIAFGAFGLVLSHGSSFFLNFLGRREYLRVSPEQQMFAPYPRVVVLHLTILFGAFAIAFFGASAGPIAVLVVVKTLIDLGTHAAEHRGPAEPTIPA